jgi:hypothetical protein
VVQVVLALRLLAVQAFKVVLALVVVLVVLASPLTVPPPAPPCRVASVVQLIALRQSQEPLVVVPQATPCSLNTVVTVDTVVVLPLMVVLLPRLMATGRVAVVAVLPHRPSLSQPRCSLVVVEPLATSLS